MVTVASNVAPSATVAGAVIVTAPLVGAGEGPQYQHETKTSNCYECNNHVNKL